MSAVYRQERVILMFWESPEHQPIMVWTMDKEPLRGVLRAPDRAYYASWSHHDLIVFFWGFDAEWDTILEWAEYATVKH